MLLSTDVADKPTLIGTSKKNANRLTIPGLPKDKTYFIYVRSMTPKHGTQLNDVRSELSAGTQAIPGKYSSLIRPSGVGSFDQGDAR